MCREKYGKKKERNSQGCFLSRPDPTRLTCKHQLPLSHKFQHLLCRNTDVHHCCNSLTQKPYDYAAKDPKYLKLRHHRALLNAGLAAKVPLSCTACASDFPRYSQHFMSGLGTAGAGLTYFCFAIPAVRI